MKGDGYIKVLKFIGAGYNDKYQVKVKIFFKNKKIFEGKTYNGEIKVDLKEKCIYKIEAQFLNETISTCLYVTSKCKYVFIFKHSIIDNTVTISLVDFYYNLPIEKGEMTFVKSN